MRSLLFTQFTPCSHSGNPVSSKPLLNSNSQYRNVYFHQTKERFEHIFSLWHCGIVQSFEVFSCSSRSALVATLFNRNPSSTCLLAAIWLCLNASFIFRLQVAPRYVGMLHTVRLRKSFQIQKFPNTDILEREGERYHLHAYISGRLWKCVVDVRYTKNICTYDLCMWPFPDVRPQSNMVATLCIGHNKNWRQSLLKKFVWLFLGYTPLPVCDYAGVHMGCRNLPQIRALGMEWNSMHRNAYCISYCGFSYRAYRCTSREVQYCMSVFKKACERRPSWYEGNAGTQGYARLGTACTACLHLLLYTVYGIRCMYAL
jgi:hypothetical protein